MKKVKLAIVEDNDVVVESILQFFEDDAAIECIKSAQNVETFLSEPASEGMPEVLLLDINLPGMSGIEGLPFIQKKMPEIDIIMLTTYDDADNVFNALKAGASAYISKRSSLVQIREAILTVAAGGSYMSPGIARKVVEYFNRSKGKAFQDFTPRQKQIINALIDGDSYQAIADKCSISVETVRDHIKKIYRKLQINSRGELIKMSYE